MSKFFQDELNYLKDAGREYARLNPKLEKYLGASATDPDMERLIEGFAFLTSRLREKIEDELPEVTHGILNTLWPQFLCPFPPCAMLKFTPKDKAITARHVIPRGTGMFAEAGDGATIPFRTAADVTVYPLEITGVTMERTRERSVLTINFDALSGQNLADIGIDDLRLTFHGEAAAELYTWSLTRAKRIVVRATGTDYWRALPAHQVKAGALGPQDALIDEPSPMFEGYRLLQEYFLMPEKLTCIDMNGLGVMFSRFPGAAFSLAFEYEGVFPPDLKVGDDAVQLYCAPVLNLFPHKADVVKAGDGSPQPLRPHVPPNSINYVLPEIYRVMRVWGSGGRDYRPYESFEHEIETVTERRAVYYRHIRSQEFYNQRWQHKIAFVDHAGKHVVPPDGQIEVELLCFNGDRSSVLGLGSICHGNHDTPSFVDLANLTVPSRPVHPPLDDGVLWAFINNLSPHYFLLKDKEAFAGLLTIYDYIAAHDRVAERSAKQREQGILAIEAKPIDWLFKGRPKRGLRTRLTLSEQGFGSEGALYLFATVLSEFMAVFATTNSFHQLEVIVSETGRRFLWDAKPGRQPLI